MTDDRFAGRMTEDEGESRAKKFWFQKSKEEKMQKWEYLHLYAEGIAGLGSTKFHPRAVNEQGLPNWQKIPSSVLRQ